MNYKNANNILPKELVEKIQQYVQGEYVYIPIKDKVINSTPTEYEQELIKRNERIYTKSLEGISNSELANIYNLSDSSIRRIIIEQRKRYEEMDEKIQLIINEWGLSGIKCEQIYDSAWQIGEEYVLKTYKDVDLFQRNIKILTILEDMNILVGEIVLTKDKKTYAKDDEYFYILTRKLSGSHIVDIKNMKISTEMGRVLALLHKAFIKCENQEEFWSNSLLGEIKGWIEPIFANGNWKYISEDEFRKVVTKIESVYDYLQVQLIHRDVHLGNFLFDNEKFSGYIDFDLSQRNIRIFDLCYFMLGLLCEEEILQTSENEWFDILKNFFLGYEQENELLIEEKQVVPYIMEAIEFLFVAWFVEQNDIKCAENAISIYRFISKNEEKILRTIC